MKKRTVLCALLALLLLLTACGGAPAASSGSASASGSSSAAGSGEISYEIPDLVEMDYSLGLLDNGRYDGITALDYVTLPKLEGMVLPEEERTVTDEEVQEQIDALLQEYATDGRIYDRAVAEGDQVNIDYVGSIDGVEFSGGSTGGAGTTVTAGSANYIDDFLTQIIGTKPGDTINVEVTFPDPYDLNPDLAGKDALFVTTINYIQGDPVVPELTDTFVAEELGAALGYWNVAQLKQGLHDEMLQEKKRIYLLEKLYEESTFAEVPAKLLDDQVTIMANDLNNTAANAMVPLDILVNYYGYESMDVLLAEYREDAVEYTEQYLMCQAAAEQLNIEVNEAVLQDYLEDVLGITDYDKYIEHYGMGYFAQDVIVHQVGEYLVSNAVNG